MAEKTLMEQAAAAARRAYSPYSGVAVGAAVEMDDGSVFTGCNIENASLGLTLCAERAALAAAVSAGRRRLRRLAVSLQAEGREPPLQVPCGACLQFVAEFADDDALILTGDGKTRRLGDYLAQPFRMRS